MPTPQEIHNARDLLLKRRAWHQRGLRFVDHALAAIDALDQPPDELAERRRKRRIRTIVGGWIGVGVAATGIRKLNRNQVLLATAAASAAAGAGATAITGELVGGSTPDRDEGPPRPIVIAQSPPPTTHTPSPRRAPKPPPIALPAPTTSTPVPEPTTARPAHATRPPAKATPRPPAGRPKPSRPPAGEGSDTPETPEVAPDTECLLEILDIGMLCPRR